MKVTKKPFVDNAIMFGLLTAGISIVMSLIYYIFDVNFFNWIFGIVNFVLLITIYFVLVLQGIKRYRLSLESKRITYWQGVLQSFLIMFIGGILSAIFGFLFYKYFDPEFMPKQVANFIVKMQEYKIPQDQLDTIISDTQTRMQPLNQLKTGLIFQTVMSLILSLIIAAFARKKDNSFEGNFN